MDHDPEHVLAFWFGDAARDPEAAAARESFWFGASPEADAEMRERFLPSVEAAAQGALDGWLATSRSALALVLLLDQLPRNLWRGSAQAFACDGKALRACEEALARGHLAKLAPVEQAFLILPFQHRESLEKQRESVRLSEAIAHGAPPEWQPLLRHYHDFASEHQALVERFGRFPHRNHALGRASTAEEEDFLRRGGPRYGQGEVRDEEKGKRGA